MSPRQNTQSPDHGTTSMQWGSVLCFIRGRRELALVVLKGTAVILSILFFIACVRSMIPVNGIMNSNNVWVGNDFVVFYTGGILGRTGEAASAYELSALNTLQQDALGIEPKNLPWRYPPTYFFYTVPFSYIDYLYAYWLWSALGIMALIIVAAGLSKNWIISLLAPLCMPVAYSMAAGQNGILSAILLGSGLLALGRFPALAGMMLGLLAYKPQLALLLPFCLLAGRHYRDLLSMLFTIVVAVLLSWLAFGTDTWSAFMSGLISQSSDAYGATRDIWERIPTVMVTTLQLGGSQGTALAAQICVALLATLLTMWIWRRTDSLFMKSLSLVAAIPLISPYVWDYDMAMLIVPAACLVGESHPYKWSPAKLAILVTMWFAQPPLRIISGELGVQVGPFVWGILLLYCVMSTLHESRTPIPSKIQPNTVKP